MPRKHYHILLFVILFFACSKDSFDKVRDVPQNENPPFGTVWLTENIYIDKFETSNDNWKEFYFDLGKIKSQLEPDLEPTDYLPGGVTLNDSNLAKTSSIPPGISKTKDFYNTYFQHKFFDFHPVIKITKEQAKKYCWWRTVVVNAVLAYDLGEIQYNPDSLYPNVKQRVKYRLPSKDEWEFAAQAGLPIREFPLGYERIKDKRDNFIIISEEASDYFKEDIPDARNIPQYHGQRIYSPTKPVFWGKPNKYGVYNLMGNVSEIVEQEGLVKSMNWAHSLTEGHTINEDHKFKRPSIRVGVRCVCEVLDE